MELLSPIEKGLLALLSLFLMSGIGATLAWSDFKPVFKNPKGILIGFASQYGWMPLIALALAKGFDLSNEESIGLIMVGCIPGGTSSNFMSYWAKGDVALSVSMTLASTLTSLFMLPLLLLIYTSPFTSNELQIPYFNIIGTLAFVILPVFFGMWVKGKSDHAAQKLSNFGNITGVLILLIITILWIPKLSGKILNSSMNVLIPAISMAYIGFFMGYIASWTLKLPEPQRRSISIETGMQNAPIALAIIAVSFPGEIASKIVWLPLIYGALVIQNGFVAAMFFRLKKL